MSSDIPRAREIIEGVLTNFTLKAGCRAELETALSMMTKASPVKRTSQVVAVITPAMKKRVRALAAKGMTNHQIANKVGLRNGGRVSEILTGKR